MDGRTGGWLEGGANRKVDTGKWFWLLSGYYNMCNETGKELTELCNVDGERSKNIFHSHIWTAVMKPMKSDIPLQSNMIANDA
jgi:hypothetical protein